MIVPKKAQKSNTGHSAALPGWLKEIRKLTRHERFSHSVKELLVELCRVDTTPRADVGQMQIAEKNCFRILERELQGLGLGGARIERRPISPGISGHPHYSLLHFTRTPNRPEGLTASEVYANRANLLFFVPGTNRAHAGESVALNAHIDVVAPYIPPRVKAGTIFGRGACDDKGPVVSIVAALKLVSQILCQKGRQLNRDAVAMFVVEEETGGNGSLSLALDRSLKKFYDSILVCECTGLKIHPANRGAVWYRARIVPLPGVSSLELYSFINGELEKEGSAIRAESRHPLFPQRPVQTCHGILGAFGEHPSRICGNVVFAIEFPHRPNKETETLVRDCIDAGLAEYIGLYGDKTKVVDPRTGKALVTRHYDFRRAPNGFLVRVYGATGHMGAIRERDGALTKMSHLVRALVASKARLKSAAGGPVDVRLETQTATGDQHLGSADGLVAEGGQGFVPTHRIEEIMQRLRQAAERGAANYLRRIGRSESGEQAVKMTYEKLHNAAFDGDPGSATMRRAEAISQLCGLSKGEPAMGWTVSCDARLFAAEYPEMPVLTFGPGQLAYAHSDQEQIELEEIIKAAEFLAAFLLIQTGTEFLKI